MDSNKKLKELMRVIDKAMAEAVLLEREGLIHTHVWLTLNAAHEAVFPYLENVEPESALFKAEDCPF